MEDIIIGEIKKNDSDVIRITINEYGGTTGIDIRLYFTDEKSGEKRPTKKGIRISPDQIEALIENLEDAKAEYDNLK